jgi:hypothetical protein
VKSAYQQALLRRITGEIDQPDSVTVNGVYLHASYYPWKSSFVVASVDCRFAVRGNLHIPSHQTYDETNFSYADGNAVVHISNVMVMNNNTGLSIPSGQIISFGNNRIALNTTNGTPSSTISQQ